MRQLHSIDTIIIDMLNRGFAPSRSAYPTLAGRQKLEVSGLCHKGSHHHWINQGLFDAKHLRSSLINPDQTQKNSNFF
jgi:hypothetical protein